MSKVHVQMTNGFGNNIFQYVAGKILAEYHNLDIVAIPPSHDYYGISCLEDLGIKFQNNLSNSLFLVGDHNYVQTFKTNVGKNGILLNGYFENYKYYIKLRKKIMEWFPKVEKREDDDLVIHLRTGDRLFYKNEFYTKPKAQDYIDAINQFSFERVHIVTDLPEWKTYSESELESAKFHLQVPSEQKVPIEESVSYLNSLVDSLSQFEPIVKKRKVGEDFNFIRSFNNILFEHGTLGWWASFLSDANKVGVYGPWRPWKGSSNKNLSNVPLESWFKWGK